MVVEAPSRASRDAASESPAERYARDCRSTARWVALADLLALTALAGVLLVLSNVIDFPSGGFALRSGLLFAASAPIAFALFGLYTFKSLTVSPFDEARALASALVSMAFVWIILGLIVRPGSFGKPEAAAILVWLPAAFLSSLLIRGVVRGSARRRRPERILIVGAGRTGQRLAQSIAATTGDGVDVVGFVDDNPLPLDRSLRDLPVFNEEDGLDAAVLSTGATRLVLAFSQQRSVEMLEAIRSSDFGRMPVSIVPRYFEITPPHSKLSELDGFPLIDLKSTAMSRGARLTKRTLDLAVSLGALIVLSPLFLLTAIAIKVDSRGPVFFRQERMGSRGRTFRIWKFRSMGTDAEDRRFELAHLNDMEDSGPLFKIKEDPRVTRVGRILRRTSIDELPQLFNVVQGTMSLVGPRPFVVHEAVQIAGWGRRRLDLTPGITGLWQVSGRNDVSFEEMVRLDYMYVTNWSVWWDLRLLLQTVPRVLSQRGAS